VVLDAFAGVAILGACASILAWLLLKGSGISTPLVYDFHDRVRGFFNEGGPYGMFLVGASLAVLLRAHLKSYVYRFHVPATLALFGVALLLSGSKAGLLAAAGLAALGVLFAGNRRQKLVLIAATVLSLAILSLFERQLVAYWFLYQDIEEIAVYHPDDPNYVMGRVTGALIVPRMIAAHPILGIGLGNYSLMRNDPEYLQGLPAVDEWDLTGMGLIGAMAELGIPLALCLFAILLRPLRMARKRKAASVAAVAAAFQPVSFLLGVNLNFFYPWLITALALASQCADAGAP
jgi:O-antigen ligase